MPKRAHRSTALARRRELTPSQVASLSQALQRRFLELPEYQAAREVALYAPIRGEVDTAAVAAAALAAGKKLLYPAVVGDDLKFCRVGGLGELTQGSFGILEPNGPGCDPAAADLVVVPGVAFDMEGRRIGYGKGYYDRALHRLEGSGKLVAFCYDFQLLQEIVGEPHDVTMDLIVTESRVVRVNKHISEGEQQ
ncbi:5-formyltetrahydrofolate cyclo-ligase [Geomonas ferrireducens]|uniref:5-formyltetrahydrofolate cyclo-ligase n=1 Tax=Geomonas ferrireducens TaxID=2570227 RepID=UPI0010A8E307|nr:5-formyltetrahydrofolate cyclo-ligase [Geomonas ferrireducens]